jgi:hypothetical protein
MYLHISIIAACEQAELLRKNVEADQEQKTKSTVGAPNSRNVI